jgi:hypothetical protein
MRHTSQVCHVEIVSRHELNVHALPEAGGVRLPTNVASPSSVLHRGAMWL